MIAYFIIACEIAFWVFVVAGLSVRYVLGLKRLGAVMLMVTPVIDVILLVATIMDLQRGAMASMVHGLAAVYVGVSIAYGHKMIAWADRRFLYWFKGGEKPVTQKLYGRECARQERSGWYRHLLSWCIGCGVLLAMIWWVGDTERTMAFASLVRVWGIILAIDFAVSFSYTLWPRKIPDKKEIHKM
ncbi:hypothetical protein D3C74_96340 [compost metagenome]